MKIPKTIFTIWLNENNKVPPLIKICIDSQKIAGYEHRLITLDNCFKDSKYIKECLASKLPTKKWTKASDYLRMHYLRTEGGIYLDADVFVVKGKNFDDLLGNRVFVGRERNGWLGTAVVASEPKHPFVRTWMGTVEANFKGDDDKCFQASMELLTKGYHEWGWDKGGFEVYPDDYFYPYNHEDGTMNMTDNTRAIHFFYKSWQK